MRTFLKSRFCFIPFLLIVLSFTSEAIARPKLQIIITTKHKDVGCSVEGGWCIDINIWGERVISLPGSGADPSGRPAEIQVSDDGRTATLTFSDSNYPARLATFDAQADYVLPAEIAKSLGCNGVTLLKGSYKVDYSRNRNGVITFNTRVQ